MNGFALDSVSKKIQVGAALVSVPICVPVCPQGYWNNTKICTACGTDLFCKTCVDGTTCSSCNTTTKALDPNTNLCVDTASLVINSCPAGTFAIMNGQVISSCQKCHPYCVTCWDGASESDCLTCQTSVQIVTNVLAIFKVAESTTTNKITCSD